MRRTTIILFGLVLSLLLFSVIFVFYLKNFEPEREFCQTGPDSHFAGKFDSINVATCKVLKLVDNNVENSGRIVGQLNVLPCRNLTEKGKFYFPVEFASLITRQVKGDTLVLRFDLKNKKAEALFSKKHSRTFFPDFYLYTDSASRICLHNEIGKFNILLKGVTLHEASVYASHSQATIDSCRIERLNVAGNYPDINLLRSTIKTFNLDLDCLYNWKIDNCKINEENLTGGGNHQIFLPKSECRKMTWLGKRKGATLNVSLESDKVSIKF